MINYCSVRELAGAWGRTSFFVACLFFSNADDKKRSSAPDVAMSSQFLDTTPGNRDVLHCDRWGEESRRAMTLRGNAVASSRKGKRGMAAYLALPRRRLPEAR